MDRNPHLNMMAALEAITEQAREIGERLRCERLAELGVMSAPEPVFDEITAMAAKMTRMPIAVLTFVAKTEAYVKSSLNGPPLGEESRDIALCSTAIETPSQALVVPDANLDDRFAQNPKVTSGNLAFYAGMPIQTRDGVCVGALCVADSRRREMTADELNSLQTCARLIGYVLNERMDCED